MFRPTIAVAALAAVALAACGGDPDPTPVAPGLPPPIAPTAWQVSPETARLEGAARLVARALNDPAFRARLLSRLRESRFPEQKIQLQRTYGAGNPAELRAIARLNAEPEAKVDSVFRAAPALEVYLPVPGHRARWQGDANLLVATAARDHEVPVAFDLKGGRHLLDPSRPPDTPVLAVVPVETDFDRPPARAPQATCSDETCSGSGGGAAPLIPGLYMTKAHFVQDFEGWLKGTPEFEVHVMGQKASSDSLTKYQCAGEHRSSPYLWNGNVDWNGNVLLFSQTEMNNYRAAHPGQAFRLVYMEDDDTSCEMKVDNDRWKEFVSAVGNTYRDITGAIDTGSTKRYIAAARSLQKLLAVLAGLIKTNDDLIGTALEDKVVNETHAGYNWVLRADNNVTNGWVQLEIR